MSARHLSILIALLLGMLTQCLPAAELVTLGPDNHAQYAPAGREPLPFFGDWVIRNEHITAAVADPGLITGRSASRWSIPQPAGAVISLTTRADPNSCLRVYYPSTPRYKPDAPGWQKEFTDPALAHTLPGRQPQSGKRVTLKPGAYELESGWSHQELAALAPHLRPAPRPYLDVQYDLEDGWPFLLVQTDFTNPSDTAYTIPPAAVLRVEGSNWEIKLAEENRLLWAYDSWAEQAYGILADDHQLALSPRGDRGVAITLKASAQQMRLLPGKTVTFNRRLIPGRDLFHVRAVAADLLNIAQHELDLTVSAADGPVAKAYVSAARDGQLYAAGHTDDAGRLQTRLPAGAWTIRVEAPGRGDQSVPVQLDANRKQMIECPPAARLALQVRNEAGEPIPAKVQFRGVEGTTDPFFGPETGAMLVGNLAYIHDGALQQIAPAGQYDLVVTHGPEHSAAIQRITLQAGKTLELQVTLNRQMHTPGWLSVDLHNHSSVTGQTDVFFVYPYHRCPIVDGESLASPLGRVLNLLAEDVQFAPATEHNVAFSYQPLIAQLGASRLLASPPGVGLSAGRRHTTEHHNVFPVAYVAGHHDGGIPQRPEHVQQLTWMRNWEDGMPEKLAVISFPQSNSMGVNREMDVVDVHDLLPIVEGKPIAGRDNRILDWLKRMQDGYRLPAIVGSNAYHNQQGSGGLRSYVKVAQEDLTKLDPLEVVRSVKAGRVVMTTGPFLDVSLRTPGGKTALPVDQVHVADGRVALSISVQSPDWIHIDRVQVLINGERDPAYDFTRRSHPNLFNLQHLKSAGGGTPKADAEAAQLQRFFAVFTHLVELSLEKDSFLIVVASGQGPNLRARHSETDASVAHVAVSNPIYVDSGEQPFTPHSPLDDAVTAQMEWMRPMILRKDAPPGIIRLRMNNDSMVTSRDSVALQAYPPGDLELLDPAQQSYVIAPNSFTDLEWRVQLSDDYIKKNSAVRVTYNEAGRFGVRVERSGVFPGRKGATRWAEIENPMPALPAIDSLTQVPALLERVTPWPLVAAKGAAGQVRFAVAGDQLALHARVIDHHIHHHKIPIEGSCLEVFGALPDRNNTTDATYGGYHPVRQVYLLPALGDQPAKALHRDAGDVIVATERVTLATKTTSDGYELTALIPLDLLGVDLDYLSRIMNVYGNRYYAANLGIEPLANRFLLEARVTTRLPDGKQQRAATFGSRAPHGYHYDFGRIRVEGPVQVHFETIAPLSAAPKAEPARFRLHLHNTSDQPQADQVSIALEPADAATFVGSASAAYQLAPGESSHADFQIALAPQSIASTLELIVQRSAKNQVLTSVQLIHVVDRTLAKLGPVSDLTQLDKLLAEQRIYPIKSQSQTLAQLQFAVAGDQLALLADIVDGKVSPNETAWKGSCLELFGAREEKLIGQIFLVPGLEQSPAVAYQSVKGRQTPTPLVKVATTPTATGYRLRALVPLSMLQLAPDAEPFKLEFQLTSFDAAGQTLRGTVFGSRLAYQDSHAFGRFRLAK